LQGGAAIPQKKDFNKIPPEGDSDVGPFFWGKFDIARREKNRLRMNEKWMRNYELRRGKLFQRNNAKVPLVPVNLFYHAVNRTKANLTDNSPRFEIMEHQKGSEQYAFQLNAAANYWWRYNDQQLSLDESIDNSETYGTSIEKAYFNPALEGGIGDVEFAIVDPFKFFPWPGMRHLQKMPMVFEVEVLELNEIRRRWPKTGQKVRAEAEWSQMVGKRREEVKAGGLQKTDTTNNLPNNYVDGETQAKGSYSDLHRALVVEVWVRDYSTVEEEIEEPVQTPAPDGTVVQETALRKIQVPKYPGNIRVVHLTNSGKVVLDDVPNPSINPVLPLQQQMESYLYDKYPYIKNVSNLDMSNFWGYSVIEQIEVLVKELNKKLSQVAAHLDKTVRPTTIIPKNAGIDANQISNMAGQRWFVNMAAAQFIRHLDMPSLPADFPRYIEIIKEFVDIITGLHEVQQGKSPKGVSAAAAILALQEKAATMLREKVRNVDILIQNRGRMWMSLVRNWYTEERTIRMSGVSALDGEKFVSFKGINVQGKYTFEVTTGSTMPKSSFVLQEQAISLFREGAIDQIELLVRLNYPNAEEIVKRMQAGPLMELLERLQSVGMPEEILQTIQTVASMDDNEFKQFVADQEARQNEIIHNATAEAEAAGGQG
jgi:hypothetical protein